MNSDIFKAWLNSSFLTKNNQSYIDQIYEFFLKNPHSIDISWINIFKEWDIEEKNQNQSIINKQLHSTSPLLSEYDKQDNSYKSYISTDIDKEKTINISKILQLIHSFRKYGHQYSILDPLGLTINTVKNSFLELKYYKFLDKDVLQQFDTNLLGMNKGIITLNSIYKFLKKTYCGTIGIEYMHILDINQILWIQDYFESHTIEISDHFSVKEQRQFLNELIASEELERYLGIKFPGSKRFSLEGGDVLIPMLKEAIRYSVLNHNIQEIFLGMPHRGRLNTLINVLGKNPQDLFNEFYGTNQKYTNSGDVKYHQGLYSEVTINSQIVHISLLFNPSHLEIITPVMMGAARARIEQLYKDQIHKTILNKNYKIQQNIVLPITIHGDAAISAQGVVQETLNMANTRAYSVGGTIHIVINNQIGFTTSNIDDIRSTPYCTDIAKMIQAPILHVNADDVHAVIFVTRFALNFRNKFKHDIVIDLVCYRRHGHNETDEPHVTQPMMYQKIRNHPTVLELYAQKLIQKNIINVDDIKNESCLYRSKLDNENCVLEKNWKPVHVRSKYHVLDINQDTSYIINNSIKIDKQSLQQLACNIFNIPNSITMHDRVKKIYHERMEMALGNRLFDWGGAEILAYAVLLNQGYSIRLSGEDTARGTFFHRHAIIYDQKSTKKYIPLMNIKQKQGSFLIWNSVLSEESALAFEYGYAHVASHNTLVIWEAQFGDFSNGAQVVIDQFISSGEQKWNQLCGLIMLLPHGYEGQGPEHSSCRIERYLQLCSEYNMRICIPSTPDQIYHLLHQHAHDKIRRKPLIIVSPKSLLRHPMVHASIEDFTYGSFKAIISETNNNCILTQVNKIIICTGKIYYDLVNKRNQLKKYNIAIIRIEQLYPFPHVDIKIILKPYLHVENFIWCQEEPQNQGAWYYIQLYFHKYIPNITLNYMGRDEAAAPASGYFSQHQQQQTKIINQALDIINNEEG
ncbi:2-oxoglutarate dehydrogenase E1 component [Candidatus Blochmanniella floridana]|uniref:oxoglutarate dehydrogenase (succinyl-transferring) n=1 Tax=Blochmanniella floridana TaxID=203907 RepID=Q7VR91_BLOFL|nr:2-oxoglutarate dehydrogenase E1 component [Candidatus Blochmannia floridanus]